MSKRARHTGSIQERSKGSWRIRYWLTLDTDGKQKQATETVRGTRKEAESVLRDRINASEKGLSPASKKETVSQFIHRWLNDEVAHARRPRTYQFYEMINRLYIQPVIGNVQLKGLTPGHIQQVIGSVLDKELSPSTARRTYATLHRALECALKWGDVYRNVCDAIDAPREAHNEVNPPDKDTVKVLLDKAIETPYRAAFWLSAYTGMRRGEIAGLQWKYVDLDKGYLSVVFANGRVDRKLTLTEVKSNTSRRMLTLDPTTIGVLRKHLAAQSEHRLKLGSAYEDNGLVFPSPRGRLLDPDILTKAWKRLCKALGVQYKLHDLRHHHATALIEAGVHIKTVQNRLGHSSPALTMAVYAHVSPGLDKEAANAYAKAMSE